MSFQDLSAKVVLVGSEKVGKMPLANYKLDERNHHPAYARRKVWLPECALTLNIFDTSSEHMQLALPYFYDTHAVILVYNAASQKSFDDIRTWLKEVREKAPHDCVIALVGNKLDFKIDRQISFEQLEQFANENEIPIYMECSSYTGENIDKLFQKIAEGIIEFC